ncbi:tafazzin [Capsicum galapagoense]
MVSGRWIESGADLWKDRARSLQLRLRDRLRVAVDHHCRRPKISHGYLSSTVDRWLQRFSDFRRDTLPSSSTFYRKKVSKDIDPEAGSVLTRMVQAVAVPVLGNVCHVFMHGLNRVQIYGAEKLYQVLENRIETKPLITVSNHVAAMDDPLVIAALLPPSVMLDAQNLRWTLCATDRCFRNPVTSAFFKHVKVLPVSRGDGIYQKGMDMAISKLNRGGWVHIFPEGSRSRDGGKTMGSIKRGIGRLVLDADNVPIVVPFVHTGMQDIMPVGAKLPRIGKTVTVLVGDPIEFDDLLAAGEKENMPRGKLCDAVSTRIGDRLHMLKAQVDRLAVQAALQSQHYLDHIGERAAGIVQHVDWEALGMDNYMSIEEDHVSPPAQEPSSEPPLVEKQVEENSQDRYFRLGFSRESGIVSRIKGYMDSTELMLFSARGLVSSSSSSRVKENFENIQEIASLEDWNNFWMPLYESQICNR